MKIDTSIFKAYDIRGVYPDQLNEELIEKITLAYIKVIRPTQIVLGRDARISGPSLHKVISSTLLKYGVNIIDIGECSSDMYYYACATKDLPGIMITASHNPKEYNGLKMVKKIPYFLTGDEGIGEIRDLILSDDLDLEKSNTGQSENWDILDEFTSYMLSHVNADSFKPFKVVIDPANGMVGPIIQKMEKALRPIEIIPLYFQPDGNFPNHGGDPLQSENRVDIIEAIKKNNADMGIMFDPDGDRFFVIDSTGRFIPGDFMTAILSKHMLAKNPNSSIVYDIRASLVVPDTITMLGGTPLYNRIGHSFIKKRMGEEKAVFGGEVTGHYYFSDFYYCDSGVLPMLNLFEYLSNSEKSLVEIVDEMESKYFISGEINSEVEDVQSVLKKLEDMYKNKAREILKVDGITVEMGDYRFNVRGSNTEPKIRLNLEAKNKTLMEEKRDEILAIIRQ